jgi:hypothetical protein
MPSPPFMVFSISNWLNIVLRCSLNSVLVFLSIGFDLTFINVSSAAVVLLRVYCCMQLFLCWVTE